MNEKFYSLPLEKQQRIINAGFRVFSRNSYKKSPMQEIAQRDGKFDPAMLEKDFQEMLAFWKSVYLRKET